MDEKQLGELMLKFEREQVILRNRPPLPCDLRVKLKEYKRPDRTKDLLHHINAHNGITTKNLFEQVNFSYEDFQAALRTLVKRGQVLVGQQGRSKIYFPMVKGR